MLTTDEILQIVKENYDTTFLKFELVSHSPSKRADVSGIMKLIELFPHESKDIISDADHDIIYFSVDIHDLANNPRVDKDAILYLMKCGIHISEDEYLSRFI